VTDAVTERVHRPRDRKQRIVTAAAQLFRDRGYHNVSLADVAGAVGITAPAVYRHFRNKHELLWLAVQHGLDDLDRSVRKAATIDEYIHVSVKAARDRHALVALWQREARHLSAEERAALRARVRRIAARLAGLIRADRPELGEADAMLVVWALLSVFASFANHRVTLPRRDYEQLLERLCRVVVGYRFVPAVTIVRTSPRTSPAMSQVALSRREQLLTSAIRLMDERGYRSVNMGEIGAATGIAGPSIYKHYSAKSDLLAAALSRGYEQLQAGITQALEGAGSSAQALERLLAMQVEYAMQNRSLIAILISERDELPEKDAARVHRAQRDVLDTWVRVLDTACPGLNHAEARVTVNVVFAVINNLVRTPSIAARSGLAEQLHALGMQLLTAR
jgi:AcrR family transcriptional regulator